MLNLLTPSCFKAQFGLFLSLYPYVLEHFYCCREALILFAIKRGDRIIAAIDIQIIRKAQSRQDSRIGWSNWSRAELDKCDDCNEAINKL